MDFNRELFFQRGMICSIDYDPNRLLFWRWFVIVFVVFGFFLIFWRL